MEGTNQAPTMSAQAPSAMPTVSVPSVAPSQPMNQSPTYQASPQAQVAPAYQAQAQGQQGSAGNPWQEAFQALSASLNSPSPSQPPAQQSTFQQVSQAAPIQEQWVSAPQVHPSAQMAAPTYGHQVSTPTYSAQPQYQAQAPMQGQSQEQVSDAYLSQVSDQSLEVLQHFGAEAPALLNQYACAVEDALIEQVQRGQAQTLTLNAAAEERSAMNTMLTHPDVLADYVNDFFGPEGPYPTETAAETEARVQHEQQAQMEAEMAAYEQGSRSGVPQNFQRPVMDMPTPGHQANQTNDFWGNFAELMDNNPENAWQYLSQAPQGAYQSKMLIQET